MKTAVLLVNFGEPETPTLAEVTPFLERIFQANAPLEGTTVERSRGARSRELAAARAPGLVETYRMIGGSPLNAQSREQAAALQAELQRRGLDVICHVAFQFIPPSAEEAMAGVLEERPDRLVALPVYPLCGPSTTVAALASVGHAVRSMGWDRGVLEIGGWHLHPDYLSFQTDHIRQFCQARRVDPRERQTALLFSIHGTPIRYLEAGSRYDRYVEEACAGIADSLGVARYHIGYQNHTNRPIEWTKPDVEEVVRELEANRVVVVAPSFMHEQSETLAELDYDLRTVADERGIAFHRVPIPYLAPRFIAVLADMVQARLDPDYQCGTLQLRRCLCRAGGAALCTNGLRGEGTVRLRS